MRTKILPHAVVACLALPSSALCAEANEPEASSVSSEATMAPRRLELTLDVGSAAGSSTWPNDPAAFASSRVGLRFHDVAAVYLQARMGYASVNKRVLSAVALGAQAWAKIGALRPYARVGLVHQHEEGIDAVEESPGSSLFGVAEGIRHRYGVDPALGIDLPVHRARTLEVALSLDASVPTFFDDKGPRFYVMGGLGIGLRHAFM